MKKALTLTASFFLAFACVSVTVSLYASRKVLSVQATPRKLEIDLVPPQLTSRDLLPFEIKLDQLYVRATNEWVDELQQELELEQRAKEMQHAVRQQHSDWTVQERRDGGFCVISPANPSLASVRSILKTLRMYVDADNSFFVVNMDAGTLRQAQNIFKNLVLVNPALDEMKRTAQPPTTTRQRRSAITTGEDSIKSIFDRFDACQTADCLETTAHSNIVNLFESTSGRFQVRFKLLVTDLDECIIAWIQLLNDLVDESMQGRVLDAREEPITFSHAWSLLFEKLLREEDASLQAFFQTKLALEQQETLKLNQSLNSRWERLFQRILQQNQLRAWFDLNLKQGLAKTSDREVGREYVSLLRRLKRNRELLSSFERCRSNLKEERPTDRASLATRKSPSTNTRSQLGGYNDDDMLPFGIELSFLYPKSDEWLDSLQTRLEYMMQLQDINAALGEAGISSEVFRYMKSLKITNAADVWKLAQEHKGFELVSPLNPSLESVETVVNTLKDMGVRSDRHMTALHVSVDARNKTVEQIGNVFKNFVVIESALDEIRDPCHRAGRSKRTASIAKVFPSVEQAFRRLDACESVACLEKTAEPTESVWYPMYIMCLRVKDDSDSPDFTKLDNLRFEFRGIKSSVHSKVALGWIYLLNRIVQESFRGHVLEPRERTVDEAWSALYDNLLPEDKMLRQFFEDERIHIHNATQGQTSLVNSRWARIFDVILANADVRASFDGVLKENNETESTYVDKGHSALLLRLQRDPELRKLFDRSRSLH